MSWTLEYLLHTSVRWIQSALTFSHREGQTSVWMCPVVHSCDFCQLPVGSQYSCASTLLARLSKCPCLFSSTCLTVSKSCCLFKVRGKSIWLHFFPHTDHVRHCCQNDVLSVLTDGSRNHNDILQWQRKRKDQGKDIGRWDVSECRENNRESRPSFFLFFVRYRATFRHFHLASVVLPAWGRSHQSSAAHSLLH